MSFNLTIGLDAPTLQLIAGLSARLDQVLLALSKMETRIMATLDDLLADVTAETTTIDSLQAVIDGIETRLNAALANTALTPAVQAQIDAVFAGLEANKAALAAAVAANVSSSAPPAAADAPPVDVPPAPSDAPSAA